jgi:hypothetical protein
MASIDTLPPDQRAVLQLVLQQGRRYDEIARLLSIDRAAVRRRALDALDALGPQTRVPPERRALITDYLLGQLPAQVSEATRDRLARSAGERAWARVLASELAPLSRAPLPEIDSGEPAPAAQAGATGAQDATLTSEVPPEPAGATTPEAGPAPAQAGEAAPLPEPPRRPPSDSEAPVRRSAAPPAPSWVGGATLLALGALVVAIVVVIIIATSGSGTKQSPKPASVQTGTSTTTSTAATQVIAKDTLTSPTGSKGTLGVAEVYRVGTATGLVIAGQGVPANSSRDAYAVWLYNSPSDSHLLGFINPGVTANGKLQTQGALPTNASHYKQLLVTLETQAKPSGPGRIVLKGALTIS